MLLHLGCGQTGRPRADYLQCDLYPGPNVDCVFDLMEPWPFADDSVQGIYASHVLEHLPNPQHFFREAYRVLEDRCLMQLRMPYGGHRDAWCDITHLRPWYPESFAFLQPGYAQTIHNPQHDSWQAPFVIEYIGQRVSKRWLRAMRWWPLRKRLLPQLGRIPDAIEELWVEAFPVKQAGAQAHWKATRPANMVPTCYLMYQHEWRGEQWVDGMPLTMLNITSRVPGAFH